MPKDAAGNHEEQILRWALSVPPPDRYAFLEKVCAGDDAFRERILKLLQDCPANGPPLPDASPTISDRITAQPVHVPAPPAPTSSASESSVHGRFLPGTRLSERYRITSLIGRGGMGEVYRADDLKLGQVVALKFLPRDFSRDERRLRFFIEEVRLARQISHPNVCRVYDIGELDGQHFLSMEYVDGEDLRALLRRIGRLPKEKAIHLAQQLCAGVAAAHEQGVLHRDLKPANIMIDGRGQARIMDFGLARSHTSAVADSAVVGTIAYMAPEQLRRGETTIQSDLYALGLILYEMFTGQRVHPQNSVRERIEAEDGSSPAAPASLVGDMDPVVERAVMRCLEKEPTQRPRSARAVAASLPGGDPLAAAVAAGETPSPEMVAAAGGGGALSPAIGYACLGGVLALLVVIAVLSQWTGRFRDGKLPKHPQALAADARRVLDRLACRDVPKDSAFGFDGIEQRIWFWYRQSPKALTVREFYNAWGAVTFGATTDTYPAWSVPGEAGVHLSPKGELLLFRVIPTPSDYEPLTNSPPKWREWFPAELTGIELRDFEPVEKMAIPPPYACDEWRIWRRPAKPATDEVYVLAAAFANRPVYFEVLNARQFADRRMPPGMGATSMVAGVVFSVYIYIAVLLGGILLAWRNLRLGRCDRRGAARLTAASFCICLFVSLLMSSSSVLEAGNMVNLALAQASFVSMQTAVYYLALEPLVRRVWPTMLVSCSRLMAGRWRDPLIGRDILMGAAAGCVGFLASQLAYLAPIWIGRAPTYSQNWFEWWTLEHKGMVAIFAIYCWLTVNAVFYFMLFTLLSRLLFSRMWMLWSFVAAVWTALLCLTWAESPSIFNWVLYALLVFLFIANLVRFGFAAAACFYFTLSVLSATPITTNLSDWYAGNGLAGLGMIAALAAFGWFTSGGNRLLSAGAPRSESPGRSH